MALPSPVYWQKRSELRMMQIERGNAKYLRDLDQLYFDVSKQISEDIDRILGNFMRNADVTKEYALTILRELLDPAELNRIQLMAATIEDPAERARMMAQVNAPAYRARITRLEAIKLSAEMELAKIAPVQIQITDTALRAASDDMYLRTVFDVQKGTGFGFSFARLTEKEIDTVIKQKWSGKHYSNRVWKNTKDIADKLPKIIRQNVITGKSWRRSLDDVTDLVEKGGLYSAKRILRTETAFVANEMEAEAYEEVGIDSYKFVATLDNRTSEVCQKMDGKIVKLKDRKTGVNFPPLHPFCRSTTVEYDEDLEKLLPDLKRRARDPKTGKTILVPRSMTYSRWKKEYAA